MQTAEQPVEEEYEYVEGMWHSICDNCNNHHVSLCGLPMDPANEVSQESIDEVDCIVCAELEKSGCPRCGHKD